MINYALIPDLIDSLNQGRLSEGSGAFSLTAQKSVV